MFNLLGLKRNTFPIFLPVPSLIFVRGKGIRGPNSSPHVNLIGCLVTKKMNLYLILTNISRLLFCNHLCLYILLNLEHPTYQICVKVSFKKTLHLKKSLKTIQSFDLTSRGNMLMSWLVLSPDLWLSVLSTTHACLPLGPGH